MSYRPVRSYSGVNSSAAFSGAVAIRVGLDGGMEVAGVYDSRPLILGILSLGVAGPSKILFLI